MFLALKISELQYEKDETGNVNVRGQILVTDLSLVTCGVKGTG
jgi:hypothetical protein